MDSLEDETLPPDPYPLFARWRAAAEAHAHVRYAGAMTLSTVAPDGAPSARVVLLHAARAGRGFFFFTDMRSPKGQALAQTPRAALTLHWDPLERQVRVRGPVQRAARDVADRFFGERPRRSRLTAWASPQSRPLLGGSAATLGERMDALQERFAGRAAIPRPPWWHAYRLRPARVEFWEAAARRLHTRVRYVREGASQSDGWHIERLAP